MNRTPLATTLTALALATLALAGCTDDPTTTLRLELPDGTVVHAVAFDADARPTQARHEADGATHSDGYTAFDQLHQASQKHGFTYQATHNADFGYFLTAVGGVAADPSYQFWSLAHNGAPAEVGMGALVLSAGDVVTWSLEAFGEPPSGDLSLDLSAAERVTRNASVRVTVNGTPGTMLTVALENDGNSTPVHETTLEPPVTLDVMLPFGRSVVVASLDDGTTRATERLDVVRLAQLTVTLQFNNYPGKSDRTDTVWMDVDAHASAHAYDAVSASHPGYANVHDLLVTWEATTNLSIEYGYSASFGYGVERIDGAGNPVDSSAPPWWCYTQNGESAELGITLQPVAPGDAILWDLGACGFVPM